MLIEDIAAFKTLLPSNVLRVLINTVCECTGCTETASRPALTGPPRSVVNLITGCCPWLHIYAGKPSSNWCEALVEEAYHLYYQTVRFLHLHTVLHNICRFMLNLNAYKFQMQFLQKSVFNKTDVLPPARLLFQGTNIFRKHKESYMHTQIVIRADIYSLIIERVAQIVRQRQ